MGCVQSKYSVQTFESSSPAPGATQAEKAGYRTPASVKRSNGIPVSLSPAADSSALALKTQHQNIESSQQLIVTNSDFTSLDKKVADPTHSGDTADRDFKIPTAVTRGVGTIIQTVVAAAVSAEVLVAVGDVLELVSAVPFPGTVCQP